MCSFLITKYLYVIYYFMFNKYARVCKVYVALKHFFLLKPMHSAIGFRCVVRVSSRWLFSKQYSWNRSTFRICVWNERHSMTALAICKLQSPTGLRNQYWDRRARIVTESAHVVRNHSCWRPKPEENNKAISIQSLLLLELRQIGHRTNSLSVSM